MPACHSEAGMRKQEISWYTDCTPKNPKSRKFAAAVPMAAAPYNGPSLLTSHRMTTTSTSAAPHSPTENSALAQEFVQFAIAWCVLRFGEF